VEANCGKVFTIDLGVVQGLGAGAKIVLVTYPGPWIVAEWHIEFVPTVDSIKPVKARLVEEDKPCGYLGVSASVDHLPSQFQIEGLLISVALQNSDHFFDLVSYPPVPSYEPFVTIGQNRRLWPQMKEQGATADEGLVILAELDRKPSRNSGEQLPLATRPF
jgi:hypothetical protein